MNNQQKFISEMWTYLIKFERENIFKVRHQNLVISLNDLKAFFELHNFNSGNAGYLPYLGYKSTQSNFQVLNYKLINIISNIVDELIFYLERNKSHLMKSYSKETIKFKKDIETFRKKVKGKKRVTPSYLKTLYNNLVIYYKILDEKYIDILSSEIEVFFDNEDKLDIEKDFILFDTKRKVLTEFLRELIRKGFSREFLEMSFSSWMNKVKSSNDTFYNYYNNIIKKNLGKNYEVILKISIEESINEIFESIINESKNFTLIENIDDELIERYTFKLNESKNIKNKLTRIKGIKKFFESENHNLSKFISIKLVGNDYTSVNYTAYEKFLENPSLFLFENIQIHKTKYAYEGSLVVELESGISQKKSNGIEKIYSDSSINKDMRQLSILVKDLSSLNSSKVNQDDVKKLLSSLNFFRISSNKINHFEEFILLWFSLEQLCTQEWQKGLTSIISKVEEKTISLLAFSAFKNIFTILYYNNIKTLGEKILHANGWVFKNQNSIEKDLILFIKDSKLRSNFINDINISILDKYRILYFYNNVLINNNKSLLFYNNYKIHSGWNIKKMYFYRNLLAHNGIIEGMNLSLVGNELREILLYSIKKLTQRFINFNLQSKSSYVQNIHGMINTNKMCLKKLIDMKGGINVWYTKKDKDNIILESLLYPKKAAYEYDQLFNKTKNN